MHRARNLQRRQRIPNTETGTMDLEFKIDEGQKSYIEKIEIRGNTKTKDSVIRRELAVSPGEVFDMVRVRTSKQCLEGLDYFEKVDARPKPTDVPDRKDLVIGVEEKNTGNLTVGAGFSSVDSLVGFAEVTQGNFDLVQSARPSPAAARNSACEFNWERNGRIMKWSSSSRGFLRSDCRST